METRLFKNTLELPPCLPTSPLFLLVLPSPFTAPFAHPELRLYLHLPQPCSVHSFPFFSFPLFFPHKSIVAYPPLPSLFVLFSLILMPPTVLFYVLSSSTLIAQLSLRQQITNSSFIKGTTRSTSVFAPFLALTTTIKKSTLSSSLPVPYLSSFHFILLLCSPSQYRPLALSH